MEAEEMIPENNDNIKCLKKKITNACKAKRFCGVCLEDEDKLWAVDTQFDIAVGQQTHKKFLKDIIDYILNDEGHIILASMYLCSHCTEKSIQSYLFIYNAKQLSKILNKCVNELYSKTIDVSEQLKPLSDYCDNSNVVIVLDQDAEMSQYTDIGKMTEIIAKETPKTIKDEIKNLNSKIETERKIKNYIKPIEVQNIEALTENISTGIEDELATVIPIVESIDPTECNKIDVEIEEINLQNVEEVEISDDMEVIYLEDHLEPGFIEDKVEPPIATEDKIPKFRAKRKWKGTPKITYKCPRCRVILPSDKAWKGHKKNCRKQKIDSKNLCLKCKMCKETFISHRLLNLHYKTHAKTRCKVCMFIVPEKELAEHMTLNHEDYTHLCNMCNFFAFSHEALKAHIKKNHSGPKCGLCLKTIKGNDLRLHKCRFNCIECTENICMHYKYLVSYRDQVLNNATKIKCVDCDYVCPKRETLLGHVNREHLDHHPFTCDHCLQQFYSRSTLRYHLNQFHKDHFICEFCDQEFTTKSKFDMHKESCQSIKREYKCDCCTTSFSSVEELSYHMKLRHDNEDAFHCNLCNKKLLSKVKLQDHLFKIHSGIQIKRKKSIMDCPICNRSCKNKTQLFQHIQIHGPDARFPCKECNADFNSITKLRAHVRIHYDDVIQCVDCKKVLTTSFFPHHMVYCKPGREEVDICTCETCGKTCQNRNQLKLHLKVHLEKVPCPICKKPTKPAYLKNHIRFIHGKPRKPKVQQRKPNYFQKCEQCGHMVSRLAELEAHTNRFHLKIKPYKCSYCPKSFFGKERLRDHLITHTSMKATYCGICNQKFQNNACLKLHMRLHTGETPYACEICGDRFRTSSIMNTHKVKKHSERTVCCPLCNAMFFLTREMRSHFKKVHWKQKDKKFDPRDVKELNPKFYYLFEDGRLPKVNGQELCISSKFNEKFDEI